MTANSRPLLVPSLTAVLICIGCGSASPVPTAVTVDYTTTHQIIEGFGAAAAYDAAELVAFAEVSSEVYDLLFGMPASGQGLGLDIFRIKNTYQHPDDTNLAAIGTIVAAAKARNPNLKTELVAWSPIASLKSNNDIDHGGTLAKAGVEYAYDAYATWWADSLAVGWAGVGVTADYVSPQNEPDALTDYESCLFSPTETASHAGYDVAFDTVRAAIAARVPAGLPAMPKMIGPESMGYQAGAASVGAARGARDYIDHLTTAGKADLHAYSFHPYADGGGGGSGYDHPDRHLSGMRAFAADARYGDKPLFMTEYIRLNQDPTFEHAIKLAWHIHNFLVEMKVSAYIHWSLFRSAANSTGGLINFDAASNTYAYRDLYYFFKHYSYFTDPGWSLVGAANNSGNLRITAFKDPDGHKLTVVILNKSGAMETFPLAIEGFVPVSSQVFRSSATEHWAPQGAYAPGMALDLPPLSIVTIAFADS